MLMDVCFEFDVQCLQNLNNSFSSTQFFHSDDLRMVNTIVDIKFKNKKTENNNSMNAYRHDDKIIGSAPHLTVSNVTRE